MHHGKAVVSPPHLAALRPFLDSEGLLRVGRRLSNADVDSDMKHPVILHGRSPLVHRLVESVHRSSLHAGPTTLLALLAERYHIIGVCQLARSISSQCVVCQRTYLKTTEQLMGQLPFSRVNPTAPFQTVGIDFAGPFTTRRGNPRKPTHLKTYIAIFICFSTRAVHLEACSDLSTSAMLASFSRCTARRGLPTAVYTDNGTNFQGAAKELADCFRLLQTSDFQDKFIELSSLHPVEWHFSPALAPHFGGLWEAGVCLMKGTLQKILPPHLLTFEEFATVVTEVEAILKSRPLLTQDSHPQDGSSVIIFSSDALSRPHRDHSSKISHCLSERGGSLSVILFKAFGGAGEHSISSR